MLRRGIWRGLKFKQMKKKIIIMSGIVGMLTMVLFTVYSCREEWPKTVIWLDTSSLPDTIYQNPVFEPDLADPTFIKTSDGKFYAYGTENTWKEGEHHIVPIIMSKDLINWTYVSDAFTSSTKPKWGTVNAGVWAPQIVYGEDGVYYLYYSLSTWGDASPGIGVATATSPEGPFTDQGKVFNSTESGVANGIDPFFITVGSGRNKKNYMFWGSFRGIYCVEMTDYKTPKLATKKQIANGMFEAVYIYQYSGKFYFFGSSGSCCEGANSQYRVTVAKADAITGPYLAQNGNGILTNGVEGTPFLRGDQSIGWVGPGHNGEIIQDDNGRYFILYHAINVNNPLLPGGATRRPLMLDEITWVDGWPVVNHSNDNQGKPSHGMKESPYFETE